MINFAEYKIMRVIGKADHALIMVHGVVPPYVN